MTNNLQTVHSARADPRSPFNNHDCESCHGASPEHLRDAKLPVAVVFDGTTAAVATSSIDIQNDVCLGCHQNGQRTHWQASEHQAADLSCVSCHNIHAAQDPVLSKLAQPAVCEGCHAEKRSQLQLRSHHPVPEGLMTCSDCHNPQWRAGSGYANAAYGTMAQAPDNQFQALSLSRVMALGEQTTLSATPIRGRLQQDELLLPFSSVFVAAAPLPSDRLQGSIKTCNGAVIPAQATVVRRINPAEEKQSGAALPLRRLSKQRLRARQRCRRYPQQRVAAR